MLGADAASAARLTQTVSHCGEIVYVLFDTNLVLGYYLPRALDFRTARSRVRTLVDSVRSGQSNHFFYLPNFCIAEVFSSFAKYSFGQYNRHVARNGGTIDTRVYQSLCGQFRRDIHNGRLFYQLELNRYHVLAIDLVAPIDHYFKIRRTNRWSNPAGTFDQLIVGMAIHLAHVHGQDNVVLVTADSRLTDLVQKCRQDISEQTIERLKLQDASDVAGKDFGPDIFPEALHLGRCRDVDLGRLLGEWPLPVGHVGGVYKYDA